MKVGSMNGFSAAFEDRVLIQSLRFRSAEALPNAIASTLNMTAHRIEQGSRENAKRKLTVRGKYTTNGIKQHRRARGRNADRMMAGVRIRSEYMAIQNAGGIVRAKRRRYPINTISSRSGSMKNVVRRNLRMDRMGNFGESYGGTTRFFAGAPKGRGNIAPGVYYRHANNKRLMRVVNLSERQVRVPESGFFDDAISTYASYRAMNNTFRAAAKVQLRRR
jgi:hypothetical protein